MIFAINGEMLELTTEEAQEVNRKDIGDYRMVSHKQVDEAEMFRVYRKNKNIKESKRRIEGDDVAYELDMDVFGKVMSNPASTASFNPQVSIATGKLTASQMRNKAKRMKSEAERNDRELPFSGAYIVPKMFGYFPFLDCDDLNTYTEAKFELSADGIPHSCYKSNKYNHYWIFCDKQCEINEAIDFIESYPCDHRYPWIARFKQELCVRAVPKGTYAPVHEENHLEESFTDDFTYWNSQFVKYWDSGLIPSYVDMLNTMDNI